MFWGGLSRRKFIQKVLEKFTFSESSQHSPSILFSAIQRSGLFFFYEAFCGVARQLATIVLREKSGSDLDHICIRDSAPTSRSILCGYQSRLRSLVGWHADLVESRAPVLASPRRGCRHSVTVSDSRNLPSRPAIIKFYAGPFFFCGARSVL